jgi:small-conductance mechanosensitive channel
MDTSNFSKLITNFDDWARVFAQTRVFIELGALLLCSLLAWWSVTALRKNLVGKDEQSIWFGRKSVDGVLFPLVLLLLAWLARQIFNYYHSALLFKIAIPILIALVVIRVGVKVLQAAFQEARWVRTLEHTISWVAWLLMVLWVSGLLPVILNELDEISWKVGSSTLSVRKLLEGVLTAGAVLIFTLWISSGIESRILRSATGGELSLRKAVSNGARALLLFVGFIVALSAVGIDLTALSVLGGAVGVGIGLGLQKLASNYVSGFVILAERSMRIGDNVKVDNFEGMITQINTRYTVIKSSTGRESIVPNELLITSRVENLALSDSQVYQTTSVSVAYNSDVDLVQTLLVEAASAQLRILQDPSPAAMLSLFGENGLEFTLGYWISDPENGQANLRSEVNLAILASFRKHGIEIPYPQRVVNTTGPNKTA